MPQIPHLMLAALTRDGKYSGSSDQLNVTINIDGKDVAVAEFVAKHPASQGYLQHAEQSVWFDWELLTNSSVRIGNRGDDAWEPQHILLFGDTNGVVVPFAMETDLKVWLSSDAKDKDSKFTVPLRPVGLGGADMPIQRLLLLVRTADKEDAGTDSNLLLTVKINQVLFVSDPITNTTQDDLERGVSNWYYLPVQTPFRKLDLDIGLSRIELEILGDDQWLPDSLYLFGVDTPDSRPNKLIPLTSNRIWYDGVLSTDDKEGRSKVELRLA